MSGCGVRGRGGIAILGNYGNRNLGNEATLAALLHAISARQPDARLYAVTFDPDDTTRRHRVSTLPARRRARSSGSPGSGPPGSCPTRRPIRRERWLTG